jgi:hypothetical protein
MPRENRLRAALSLLLPTLGMLLARPAAGQDNLDAMTKWTEAKVVHYRIAGDFAGKMRILGGTHTIRHAEVTDHVEFEFDWDNQEMKLLGTPVVRNFPTKLGTIDQSPVEGCPPARIDAAPEYATLTRVTAQFVQLTLEFTQRSAAGALPWVHETSGGKCGDLWDQSAAGEGSFEVSLQVLPAMMLAMPAAARGFDVSKDGKTMLPRPENGWAWAITPSIVR